MIFWKIKANFCIFNVAINQLVKSKITRYWFIYALVIDRNLNCYMFLVRIGKKYVGCILVGCIDVTIKFEEDIDEQICLNLSIDDEIIFAVTSFTPSQMVMGGKLVSPTAEQILQQKDKLSL